MVKMEKNNRNRPPVWFIIVIIVMLLPLFSWPAVVAALPAEEAGSSSTMMLYVFPVYAIMSAYYAWRCYEGRREISVILLALLLLAYAAVTFGFIM